MKDFIEFLKDPEMEYRPRNYWGWLENITPEETVWQIEKMYKAGLGGYVMHARGGLTMPYMGKQWIDSVKAMIETGKKYGMYTIVDDEHGWPSGFGAGKVNGLGEDYQLKYLLCEEIAASEVKTDKCTLGLWEKEGFAHVAEPSSLPCDTLLVRVYYKVDPHYVDNMDPKVVRAFIEASYEDYKANVGESFGDGVYGIFSDEPQTARYATPWSFIIPELFKEKYGYELLPRLYQIFYNSGDYARVRYDMYTLMQECFVNNYAKQLYDWCDANKLKFMGHTCLEDDFFGQIRCSLGTMPFYEYMHIPGIDWLCRTALNNMTILQLTSAAAQFGKRRVLSEMYGCAGWNVSLEELKWIAQWQAVLGVNDQLQHLGLYSLRGSRKREYPASLFYQQPWFEKYNPYNVYFARVSKLLTESSMETDALLIHPMKSAWICYNGSDPESTNALEKEFIGLTNTLLAMNLSIHYGDETIMAKHGKVEYGRLVIGYESYSTVILPTMLSIDESTFSLLKAFKSQGGRIIIAGDTPKLMAGTPDARLAEFFEGLETSAPVRNELEKLMPAPVRVIPASGDNNLVYIARRNLKGHKLYYIVNNDLENAVDFRLDGLDGSSLALYDPMSGKISESATDTENLHLDGGQAIILVECAAKADFAPNHIDADQVLTLDGMYRLVEATDNMLTIDRCELSFNGIDYEKADNHLSIQKRLISDGFDRDIYLRFRFNVAELPDSPIWLVMENPELQEVYVNGEQISTVSNGWVVDKCFEKLPISIVKGENTVILKRRFKNPANVYRVKNDPTIHEAESNRVTVETEIESIYIMGQFAVMNNAPHTDTARRTTCTAGDFYISSMPSEISVDRLEKSGFPFFAGSITLEKEFSIGNVPVNAHLEFDRPDSIMTGIEINGKKIADFIWAPYFADITGMLSEGGNTIRITITNSCRNMLGPHHNTECEPYGVGPHSYSPMTEDTYLVRFGIPGGVRILY